MFYDRKLNRLGKKSLKDLNGKRQYTALTVVSFQNCNKKNAALFWGMDRTTTQFVIDHSVICFYVQTFTKGEKWQFRPVMVNYLMLCEYLITRKRSFSRTYTKSEFGRFSHESASPITQYLTLTEYTRACTA